MLHVAKHYRVLVRVQKYIFNHTSYYPQVLLLLIKMSLSRELRNLATNPLIENIERALRKAAKQINLETTIKFDDPEVEGFTELNFGCTSGKFLIVLKDWVAEHDINLFPAMGSGNGLCQQIGWTFRW